MERSAAMRSARAWIRRGRCVILIGCSDSKTAGGSAWPMPSVPGVVDELPPPERNVVVSMRRSLASKAKAVIGPDLGGTSARGRYRPACERYDGRLYSRVAPEMWPTAGDSCVIIVSALYGLVFPWEPIQKYDLMMKSPMGYRNPVHGQWRNVRLGTVFASWAAAHDVRCVFDLLTQPYRAALDDLADPRAAGIERVLFEYPRRYQAANLDRGDDAQILLRHTRAQGC